MESVKLRIKDVLEEKSKSIQWLSEQLGITYANTNNIVNGKSNPSLERLNDIAKKLEVDIIELIKPTSGTIGIIRHNGSTYEINSVEDIEKLLQEIKGTDDVTI